MKTEGKNSIEDLFKSKMEEAETEPGEELTARFMRRLGKKEFLRFNLYRFNVWYAGSAAIAAAVIAFVFLSENGEPAGRLKQPGKEKIADSIERKSPESDKSKEIFIQKPEVKDTSRPLQGSFKTEEKRSVTLLSPEKKPSGQESKLQNQTEPVREKEGAKPYIQASVLKGCAPLQVKFSNTVSAEATLLWNFGDGGSSSEREPEWIYNVPGSYKVTLDVKESNNSLTETSIDIDVLSKPEASFEISPSDPEIPIDEIKFRNTSLGAKSFLWHFGDGTSSSDVNPVHKYEKPGRYDISLVAVSDFGCTDSLSISDAFTETDCFIRFPNAFTPDRTGPSGGYYSGIKGDKGIVFHPLYAGIIKYNLKVYSQQGYLVFESNDIMTGWDGYFKGKLCESGAYIWKAEGKFRNGKSYVLTGDVTLVNY